MSLKKSIILASILAIHGCSLNSVPLLDLGSDKKKSDSEQPKFGKADGKGGSFTKVMPDFKSLAPLYDLGFEGDFDQGLIAYNDKNYRRALVEWLPLAKEEDPRAEYYIGLMFMNGLGVEENYDQGILWLKLAANRDYVDAQFELGRAYVSGVKIEQNLDQGIRWLLSAAKKGHAGAQFSYGLLNQQDKVPLSSDLMALYKQSRSKTFNFTQAAKWYTLAAEQNHAAAQSNLASLYRVGIGVQQNNEEAFKWYTNSANQGVIDAQYNLGLMYEQGIATPMDTQRALFWHTKAAEQGYLPSQQRLPFLQKMLETLKTSLVLYGGTLASTTRKNLRQRLKSNFANPLREQDNYWFDIYESSKLLKSTDRLFVGYSLQTDQVASLEYRFPSHNAPNYVLQIIELINDKYGLPFESKGDLNFGEVKYSWKAKDTIITVTRYWPDTTVYLSYKIGDAYRQMVSEMPENAKEIEYNIKFETY
ncbi:sel1 repeat family protein [Psychrosphaera sp. B3R10]|nr:MULTISPECIES: tetratricopeptide repeat protein [unclassified Psychrosphaera]MBU2880507.1 sel1 repeat family protein [Psychrosphaera sp. I2R16]MBU2987900.1 sel1 repeat family protein [Psychrosphaera sp. B3R10]MDO6721411.1 tetratricopeptide repeat protein [Psychrosphaera sp. 1_MG-2023]